jgi:hypothetical protein
MFFLLIKMPEGALIQDFGEQMMLFTRRESHPLFSRMLSSYLNLMYEGDDFVNVSRSGLQCNVACVNQWGW